MLEVPSRRHVNTSCGIPRVQDFWRSVHVCINEINQMYQSKKIVGQEVPFCICLFLLGDPALLKDITHSTCTELVQTTIMLGRRLLVQQRESAHVPSTTDRLLAYEHISFSLLGRMEKYHFEIGQIPYILTALKDKYRAQLPFTYIHAYAHLISTAAQSPFFLLFSFRYGCMYVYTPFYFTCILYLSFLLVYV